MWPRAICGAEPIPAMFFLESAHPTPHICEAIAGTPSRPASGTSPRTPSAFARDPTSPMPASWSRDRSPRRCWWCRATRGGHVEHCDRCDHQRVFYNSCRDRHCPKCQGLARAKWLEDRQSELLDTPYFHVVFTLPQPIAAIALQNKEIVYNILFRAASETLRTIAADPKQPSSTASSITPRPSSSKARVSA
jgi:hypothetical protein